MLEHRLAKLAEFDKDACLSATDQTSHWDRECFFQGARWQSERLQPLIKQLIEVSTVAKDAIEQIKTQRGLWPAEVDSLDESIARLEALVGGME